MSKHQWYDNISLFQTIKFTIILTFTNIYYLGPCPLIAIANVLILKDEMKINTSFNQVSIDHLVESLANIILATDTGSSLKNSESKFVDIQACLNILPKLKDGLDLNIKSSKVNGFEFTEELSLFDTLEIPILHGWIASNIDECFGYESNRDCFTADNMDLINSLSYNNLVYKVIEYQKLLEKKGNVASKADADANMKLRSEGKACEHFLKCTSRQLTPAGILKMYDYLTDGDLAIFFRNNHFNTIYCHEGQIFLLVTDLGYIDVKNATWELLDLDGVDGNCQFVNDHFRSSSSKNPNHKEIHDGTYAITDPEGTYSLPRDECGTYALPENSHSTTMNTTIVDIDDLSIPIVTATVLPIRVGERVNHDKNNEKDSNNISAAQADKAEEIHLIDLNDSIDDSNNLHLVDTNLITTPTQQNIDLLDDTNIGNGAKETNEEEKLDQEDNKFLGGTIENEVSIVNKQIDCELKDSEENGYNENIDGQDQEIENVEPLTNDWECVLDDKGNEVF